MSNDRNGVRHAQQQENGKGVVLEPQIALKETSQPSQALVVVCLGISQLIGWGTLHYIIGVFGTDMADTLQWNQVTIHGGFSASLVVMGLCSRVVGEWIDHHGGRLAMMVGCWLGALGCLLLAASESIFLYYLSWGILGLAMRLALYDSAFATLVNVYGRQTQRSMTVVTLFGGLASTAFWPLGHALASVWGWRGALVCYALIIAASSLLHLVIPRTKATSPNASDQRVQTPQAAEEIPREREKMFFYGATATLVLFMQAGMAAHFIELLAGLGWAIGVVVSLSALLGIGQVVGRLYMVFHGHRFDVLWMNMLPPALLVSSYTMYLNASSSIYLAGAFAFLYGAGNGIATITRGAVPVALFGPKGYGGRVGRTLRPAFFASAVAPMAFAWTIGQWGTSGTVVINLLLTVTLLVASYALIFLTNKE
jgi:MFS family permease